MRARPTHPGHRRARPGLTFIEVVISIFMLTIVMSMIVGATSFFQRSSTVLRRRAEAMEAAHRIIVQHLEDRKLLITGPKRVELNGTLYGYDIKEFSLAADGDEDTSKTTRSQVPVEEASIDERLTAKLHQVYVEVYLDDPDLPYTGQTLATMSRVFNIIDPEKDLLILITELMEADIERLNAEADAANAARGPGGPTGGQAPPPAGGAGTGDR